MNYEWKEGVILKPSFQYVTHIVNLYKYLVTKKKEFVLSG